MADIPTTPDEDAEHFARLATRRRLRLRMRTAFLEKAARFSQPHRRWFRIKEIEPDEIAREELIRKWRASIYSGDLLHKGKSQVLCLHPSPLLDGYRYPPELARDEEGFNNVVDDLWMSAPRWAAWFHQDLTQRTPPVWLETMVRPKPISKHGGRKPEYDYDDVKQFVFRQLDQRGDFNEPDQTDDWNRQCHLEDAVLDYISKRSGKEASVSTVRRYVTSAVRSWRDRQSPPNGRRNA